MGTYVELRVGKYRKIREKLVAIGAKDEPFLDEILLTFGQKIGPDYILLNNEFWEENNSYYNIATFIDKYYCIDDSFLEFLRYMKEATSNVSIEEAAESLGVELPESDDDE